MSSTRIIVVACLCIALLTLVSSDRPQTISLRITPRISAAIASSILFFNTGLLAPAPNALASLAPLADVGLREFLVKDGRQFLRLELPIGGKAEFGIVDDGKRAQEFLELVKLRFEQVGFTNPSAWASALKDVNAAKAIITDKRDELIKNSLAKDVAIDILEKQLQPELESLLLAVRAVDITQTLALQEQSASHLADLRQLQLPPQTLPYSIPDEYKLLPRLLGRATVKLTVSNPKGFRTDANKKLSDVVFTVVVDGYHAPLTAGNFIDLVSKKFYDGMHFHKIEELSVQTGERSNKEQGYIDSHTGQIRTIPLELFYKKDIAPTYGYTSDEDNRATDTMALPFQSFGALGMSRDNEEADSGSSQVFLLKWKQALIAPGRNTLDGFYSCFGYVVDNQDFLSQITPDSTIVSAKVVKGMENLLIPPQA